MRNFIFHLFIWSENKDYEEGEFINADVENISIEPWTSKWKVKLWHMAYEKTSNDRNRTNTAGSNNRIVPLANYSKIRINFVEVWYKTWLTSYLFKH